MDIHGGGLRYNLFLDLREERSVNKRNCRQLLLRPLSDIMFEKADI